MHPTGSLAHPSGNRGARRVFESRTVSAGSDSSAFGRGKSNPSRRRTRIRQPGRLNAEPNSQRDRRFSRNGPYGMALFVVIAETMIRSTHGRQSPVRHLSFMMQIYGLPVRGPKGTFNFFLLVSPSPTEPQ